MIAKAEEDKLKQEVMRLEIRRTEMEMLKDALRASIPPHLVPQIFGNGTTQTLNSSLYTHTPISPTHATHNSRMPAQHAPMYKSNPRELSGPQTMASPRYLPKLETSILPSPIPTSTNEHRAAANQTSGQTQQQSESHSTLNQAQESPSSSLFFHHWQPPANQQTQGSPASVDHGSLRTMGSEAQPTSPTPRKRKLMQQPNILNPSSVPGSRRSPTRGHTRHRSEASALSSRFNNENYMPQQAKALRDHTTPSPRPPSTSVDLDAARKRKREGNDGDAIQQAHQQQQQQQQQTLQSRRTLAPPASIAEEDSARETA